MSGDRDINATMATLVDSLQNLTKSGAIERPPLISRLLSAEQHLEQVDKYIKFVNASSSSDKAFILWQSLTDDVKNEIIFDLNYEQRCNDYTWMCNKLKEMLPRRQNKTSELLELNELKQNGQKAAEFASLIKQELAKRRNLFEKNERNKLSLKIFLSGLDDVLLATAIKQQHPSTIDEALKLFNTIITKENISNSCRQVNEFSSCKCTAELKLLHGKIEYLQQLIIGFQRSMMNSNEQKQKVNRFNRVPNSSPLDRPVAENRQFRNKPIKCFNCGRNGHMSRNCRAPRNHTRFASMDNAAYSDTYPSHSRHLSHEGDADSPPSINEGNGSDYSTAECYLAAKSSEKSVARATSRKQIKIRKPPIQYSAEIHAIAEGIGNGVETYKDALISNLCTNKDKQKATSTVITKSNPERARNKPIVKGFIGDRNAKFLLDSGADINLIDRKFAESFLSSNINRSTAAQSTIRCANGSVMKCVGTVEISVSIGRASEMVIFRVVENLFPVVILGLVALKQLHISVCPWKSCAIIGNDEIPFLSKVSEIPKNDTELYLRTGIKLQ